MGFTASDAREAGSVPLAEDVETEEQHVEPTHVTSRTQQPPPSSLLAVTSTHLAAIAETDKPL